MTKKKDNASIPGLSLNGTTWLTSKKGFYQQGFQTTIHQATKLDLKNAEHYGLELVSRYTKIDPRLLQLYKINEQRERSTTTITYQVKSGIMINGKLYVTAQIVDYNQYTISFNYRYRNRSYDFFKITDTNRSATHQYNKFDRSDKTHWVRYRNKLEFYHRKKYKER